MVTIKQIENKYLYLARWHGEDMAVKLFCIAWPKEAKKYTIKKTLKSI